MTQPVEYTFNASALGIGGTYVRLGREVVVPSIASVALAPSGGEGLTQVYGYNNEQGVEVASAFSFVKGSQSPEAFTTESEIDMVGLSLFGRVFIRHMYARVKSTRGIDEKGVDEAAFEVTATYEGVRVDNCEVEPYVDADTCRATYATHHSVITRQVPFDASTPGPSLERGDPLRRSVVSDLSVNGTAVTVGTGPYILDVPGLGLMHFGELLVKRGRRRVNLVRFELGADRRSKAATPRRDAFGAGSGVLSIGSTDGNGEPVWPRH